MDNPNISDIDFIAFPLDIDKYRSGDFQSPLWQSEIAATFNVKWKCYKSKTKCPTCVEWGILTH